MSNLISREAILKHIEKIRQGVQFMDDTHRASIVMTGIHLCEDAVRNQPSAQQEQKKGKWIKATGMMPPEFHGRYCCSECGNFANMEPPFGNREDLSKFCPNCGADMRGEEDG